MYIFVVLFDRPDHRTFRTANGVVCFNPMGRGGATTGGRSFGRNFQTRISPHNSKSCKCRQKKKKDFVPFRYSHESRPRMANLCHVVGHVSAARGKKNGRFYALPCPNSTYYGGNYVFTIHYSTAE